MLMEEMLQDEGDVSAGGEEDSGRLQRTVQTQGQKDAGMRYDCDGECSKVELSRDLERTACIVRSYIGNGAILGVRAATGIPLKYAVLRGVNLRINDTMNLDMDTGTDMGTNVNMDVTISVWARACSSLRVPSGAPRRRRPWSSCTGRGSRISPTYATTC